MASEPSRFSEVGNRMSRATTSVIVTGIVPPSFQSISLQNTYYLVPSQLAGYVCVVEPVADRATVRVGGQAAAAQPKPLALRACYELGRKPHRNADYTFGLVPS